MKPHCPYCQADLHLSDSRPRIKKSGRFRRRSDGRWIQRFRCLDCRRSFSRASFHPAKNQKKRHLNFALAELFSSGLSQRRLARFFHLSRTTVARKLHYLGLQAEAQLQAENKTFAPANVIEFDDLETFEHTKLKPLSVTLAVESKTRRILGFEVSQMAAKGHLAQLSVKKYGPRPDERAMGRARLFEKMQPLVQPWAIIKSDQNPHYPADVRKYFPESIHEAHKGQRGSVVGQGELKKVRFDPLFSLNHSCAMFRANVNRLFRKTWCTTKSPEKLRLHLAIYSNYHNFWLRRRAHRNS